MMISNLQDETDSSELELVNSGVWTPIGGRIEPYSRGPSATSPAGGYILDHGTADFVVVPSRYEQSL